MPVALLNNAQVTVEAYTDARTVTFPPRGGFAVQVHNNAVYYQLAYVMPGARGEDWEGQEHHTVQSLLTFSDPGGEGLPDGAKFTGIRFRRAGTAGEIPRVTVM